MRALAITDLGNLCGVLEFWRKATAAVIKQIVGYDAFMAPNSRFDREPRGAAHSAVLLAPNQAGFRNRIRLATAAHVAGFHYQVRIDQQLLVDWLFEFHVLAADIVPWSHRCDNLRTVLPPRDSEIHKSTDGISSSPTQPSFSTTGPSRKT